ncbi:TetR/AcrR family transcriptional regulator [Pseudonocardia sp. KRD291]|uniref:TetR/AcrR family transcriptional regulator n=1 Tax=Pseudonocardia sp. KRD291 TaxID=2792007 RepID=UPI001C4A05F0|nr:TetR/AcrR family transcriptional regulator [Pseudonocardia sp. KRD291]MBW0102693.1 TetR family transcriptional regulator [Pseudonocardia sp. KRD291]
MGRWEPNARLRLVRAAIDLFAEQGYGSTTVPEIAERAALTRATFFRHFPDKREVLFAGQQVHTALLADGIAAAPRTATPVEAVAGALDALTSTFTPDQREFGPRLRAVIAGTPELQERAAFKRAGLAAATAAALRERGVPDAAACLAAEMGVHAFYRAFDRWLEAPYRETFPALARHALDELHAAAAALVSGPPSAGPGRPAP